MPRDVLLTSGDDFPHYVGELITGDTLIVQRAKIRLRTFRGEWILDEAAGLPFVEWSGAKTDVRGVVLATKREIEAIPGVKRAELSGALDATSRRTTIVGAVVFDDGTQRGLKFAPFGVLGDSLPTVVASPAG
jgi:hypothetical protein